MAPGGRSNWSADWPDGPIFSAMSSVGAYEAKTHLPELLDRVEQGERIVITRRGVPVALLVPVEAKASRDPEAVVAELLEFRKGRKLRGERIPDLIREGRRE